MRTFSLEILQAGAVKGLTSSRKYCRYSHLYGQDKPRGGIQNCFTLKRQPKKQEEKKSEKKKEG